MAQRDARGGLDDAPAAAGQVQRPGAHADARRDRAGRLERRFFTDAEKAEVRRMIAVQATVRQIADHLDRQASSVRRLLKRMRLTARVERVRETADDEVVKRACTKGPGSVGPQWTEQEIRDLAHMMAADWTLHGMAGKLGRRPENVARQIGRIRAGQVTVLPGPEKHRACMACGTAFWSTGPGHRHCDTCRRDLTEGAGDDGYSLVVPSRGGST